MINPPFSYGSLEPIISERAMILHHQSHHQGYEDKLKDALQDYPDLLDNSGGLYELLSNPKWIPEEIKDAVINFGGGVWCHDFYWRCLSPNAKPFEKSSKVFQGRVRDHFGSFKKMRAEMISSGTKHFGSGWIWLVEDAEKALRIYATPNQNTPMMRGHKPLMTIDLWEHAYYLDYENGRKEFLEAVFDNLLDWSAL